MAYATDFHSSSHGRLTDRLFAVWPGLRKAVARRRMYRQTYDELSTLNQRELNDLGITAGQIAEIARDAALMVR